MTDRRREILFGLGLLLPVLIGFAGVEWLLQKREAAMVERKVDWSGLRAQAAIGDPDRVLFKPGAQFGNISFNALGFRGPDIALPKPAGTIRIMFLGDSKTFAGEVREEQALAAQSIAKLRALHPRCSFDYVNVSGPQYSLGDLTSLVRAKRDIIDPDLTVVMAGSATDLIGSLGKRATPPVGPLAANQQPATSGLSAMIEQSIAIKTVRREIGLLSPLTPLDNSAREDLNILAFRQRWMLHQLSSEIGDVPTMTIAYRTREKGGSGIASYWLGARRLRTAFPGISAEKAHATLQLVVDASRNHAAAARWRQIDPLKSMIGQPEYYYDRSHFSPLGHAKVGAAVADEAATMVTEDCRIAPGIR
ncbi:MAG: hypothetical protein HC788_09220 [Sphingopyxis sp.]|nr:hypothetical protein [Sphingopyxis sp.]